MDKLVIAGRWLAVCALASGCCGGYCGKVYDVVIYGSSPAALSAAISAQRLGKSAVILSPETRIGGLTTGGLGQTDIGNKSAFGGLALQFYRDVANYYKDEANWVWQKRNDYLPDGQCADSKGEDSMWTFEPHAALAILEGWEKREKLDIRRGEWLDRGKGGVAVVARRITAIRTMSGRTYRGKMFVDATYEGDLMAAAGVTYFVGREDNSVYGETISGFQPAPKYSGHKLRPGIDPYVVRGGPASGLLPGVKPYDYVKDRRVGQGDAQVQAYNIRMCLTDVPENRIPFAKPDGYDEREYELLFRHLEAGANLLERNQGVMPNCKTDTNNHGGFSTDYIGRNWSWPEASYAERAKLTHEHLVYQQGLMWTLANHPRIPEDVRLEYSRWGTCRDEFQDGPGNGWQSQVYVREGRRLVGDTVMTEHHCRGDAVAVRPVAMGAYGMDSHNGLRYVGEDGCVHNEGDIQDYTMSDGKTRFPPFGIDYGAIIPKRGECANLFVPVCLSASHMAFGSIRMEPVFFALGQAAGTAAAQAIAGGFDVLDLPYAPLRKQLLADGQVVERRVD